MPGRGQDLGPAARSIRSHSAWAAPVPAGVPVVEGGGRPRARPVVVEQLAGQVGVEEREAPPLLDHLDLGDERLARAVGPPGLEDVEEAEVAVLHVGEVPGVGEQPALVTDAAGRPDPGERLRLEAEVANHRVHVARPWSRRG